MLASARSLNAMDESSAANSLSICEQRTLSARERELLDNPALDTFAHYVGHSTETIELFFVKLMRDGALLGLAPVAKVKRQDSRMLLKRRSKWWLVPVIGPFARKTTYMLDTAMMGFQYTSPFCCAEGTDPHELKRRISDHLKAKPDVDTVWIAEPQSEAAWAAQQNYDSFSVFPIVQVDVSQYASVDEYTASLSKKRRRNVRVARQSFRQRDGTIEVLQSPIKEDDLEQMYQCIEASARRSKLAVPYGDVINSKAAFFQQRQTAFVARVQGKVVGFASFICAGGELLQCHGGLDYELSSDVRAYENLMLDSIGYAIDNAFRRISFGPLNNETKRRAGTDFMPLVAHLWTRNPFFRLVTRTLVIPQLQVYTGPASLQADAVGNGSAASAAAM